LCQSNDECAGVSLMGRDDVGAIVLANYPFLHVGRILGPV
jgi:hypothetical protein